MVANLRKAQKVWMRVLQVLVQGGVYAEISSILSKWYYSMYFYLDQRHSSWLPTSYGFWVSSITVSPVGLLAGKLGGIQMAGLCTHQLVRLWWCQDFGL